MSGAVDESAALRQALAESEARLRNLIERNADGVLVVARDGRIRYVNPAAETLLGRPAAVLIGAMFGQPVMPGVTTEVDLLGDGSGGRVAELRSADIEWEGERAVLAMLRDVTSRTRAAAAPRFLAEARSVLAGSLEPATTLASVARMAVVHLADWCVIDLAEGPDHVRRVAGDHGDPEKEELARQLGGLFPLAARSKQGIVQVLRSGRLDVLSGSDLAEQLALAPGQEEVICQLGCGSAMLTPLTTAAGPMGVITLVVAAPGRRFSPDEQALALDLGHRAALALENARLYEEARNAVRRRDEFLAMLAHELRNPLAPILSGAQLMGVLGLSDPRQERARASIERQGRHLARLLDDLLDLSRVNYDKIALRREAVDLGIVAGDAVQATRALLDERGHRLTLTLGATPLIVDGDPTRLAQVLSNLLQNAAKYTPPGGRIELTAAAEGDEAVVRVTDDGAGIAPEMLGRVFEPFAQLDASLDRSGGGLGIGLTLVRRLVELHGGRVSARSAGPGMGSTFEVRLPLGRPAESVEAKDATPTSGARRVLLVEDNADGRNMLADLMRQWGHTVEEAGDGFEGVERLKRQLPDVALVDVGLPGMDGYQLAAAVRETEGGDRVLLVAVTGYGQPEDRRRALAAGFDVHLVKPIDLMTLEMLLAGEK